MQIKVGILVEIFPLHAEHCFQQQQKRMRGQHHGTADAGTPYEHEFKSLLLLW